MVNRRLHFVSLLAGLRRN